jgi:hypothetical protein
MSNLLALVLATSMLWSLASPCASQTPALAQSGVAAVPPADELKAVHEASVQAIEKSSTRALETVQWVFTVAASIIGALVAAGGVYGWKTLRDAKTEFQLEMRALVQRYEQLGKHEVSRINERLEAHIQLSREFDEAFLIYAMNRAEYWREQSGVLARKLEDDLERAAAIAEKVGSKKLLRVVRMEQAQLYFKNGMFGRAVACEREAGAIDLREYRDEPSHLYNLAVYLSAAAKSGAMPRDALRESAVLLERLLTKSQSWSCEAAGDGDLEPVFEANPGLKERLARACT